MTIKTEQSCRKYLFVTFLLLLFVVVVYFTFQLNPQKEIPVLDDDGFLLGESIAIMQYLCDQYAPENPIYPKEPKKRALVNHRMLFNMAFYYNYISQYAVTFQHIHRERHKNEFNL